jgi:uncharacterized protein YndB with AHSA1/START domain
MPRARSRSVRHRYYVRASPGRVFRALTRPAELTRWLADTAEIDLRRGGHYRLGWNGGPQHTGTVVRFVPGHELTLAWSWEGVALRGTRLRWRVERKGRGSLLTVEHSGFPRSERWVDLYAGAEWGWTYFAMTLKALLETGRDLRSPLDG